MSDPGRFFFKVFQSLLDRSEKAVTFIPLKEQITYSRKINHYIQKYFTITI